MSPKFEIKYMLNFCFLIGPIGHPTKTQKDPTVPNNQPIMHNMLVELGPVESGPNQTQFGRPSLVDQVNRGSGPLVPTFGSPAVLIKWDIQLFFKKQVLIWRPFAYFIPLLRWDKDSFKFEICWKEKLYVVAFQKGSKWGSYPLKRRDL